jgi:hypothetical protein
MQAMARSGSRRQSGFGYPGGARLGPIFRWVVESAWPFPGFASPPMPTEDPETTEGPETTEDPARLVMSKALPWSCLGIASLLHGGRSLGASRG